MELMPRMAGGNWPTSGFTSGNELSSVDPASQMLPLLSSLMVPRKLYPNDDLLPKKLE